FRSRKRGNGARSESERGADDGDRASAISAVAEQLPSLDELLEDLESTTRANREHRELGTDRRIIRLRHLAGIQLIERAPADPDFATPDASALPNGPGPVEIGPA